MASLPSGTLVLPTQRAVTHSPEIEADKLVGGGAGARSGKEDAHTFRKIACLLRARVRTYRDTGSVEPGL